MDLKAMLHGAALFVLGLFLGVMTAKIAKAYAQNRELRKRRRIAHDFISSLDNAPKPKNKLNNWYRR